jgi:uncharacterized protein YjgD (DUF1641 family)
MAQPIRFQPAPRDPRQQFKTRLEQAPLEHAEAVLAGYEVLQGLHDRGVLEVMRGTLGGGEKVIEQLVAVAGSPESIRAARNLLLLVKALGEIEPELLGDLTRAIPKALVQANTEHARPSGIFKLLATFFSRDFRRGLAAGSDLLVMFGKNLTAKER